MFCDVGGTEQLVETLSMYVFKMSLLAWHVWFGGSNQPPSIQAILADQQQNDDKWHKSCRVVALALFAAVSIVFMIAGCVHIVLPLLLKSLLGFTLIL